MAQEQWKTQRDQGSDAAGLDAPPQRNSGAVPNSIVTESTRICCCLQSSHKQTLGKTFGLSEIEQDVSEQSG